MIKYPGRKTFLTALFSIFFIISIASAAQAAFDIAVVDYRISSGNQTAKIGDLIYITMVAVDVTKSHNNSTAVDVTTTSMRLSHADFVGVFPAGQMYVYDGTHIWGPFSSYSLFGSVNTLILSNANLLAGQNVSNYVSMQYQNFSIAEGTLVTGGSAKADIGTAVSGIQIYDDGDIVNHNDNSSGDGIYNTIFIVREQYQFDVYNASLVGHFTKTSIKAGNDPFIAPNKVSIDGVRPRIELADASPNPFNPNIPNKDGMKFMYYPTENSNVTLTIYYGSVTVKALDATGYSQTLQFIKWDGLSNTGTVQGDGEFDFVFDITDIAGNTGIAYFGNLKLTTIEMQSSIRTIDVEYTHAPEPQTVVQIVVKTDLYNASLESLANLGFNWPDPAPGFHEYLNYPYAYPAVKIYDSGGNLFTSYQKDFNGGSDTDAWYYNPASNPDFFGPDSVTVTTYDYNPVPVDPCAVTNTVIYTSGDLIDGNDWDIIFSDPLTDLGGGHFQSEMTFVLTSGSISPGIYIVSAKGTLVGKRVLGVDDMSKDSATCVSTTVEYQYQKHHVQPSFFVDASWNIIADDRGMGLSSSQRTASFIVEQNSSVPLPDSLAPQIVTYSEYPSDASTISPGVIGPTNPVKIILTDDGVGAGATNLSSLTLKDPYGNNVKGRVAWNAGSPNTKNWEIYYIPDSALTIGGSYQFTIIPVDGVYNVGVARTFKFNVQDTSIPIINSAEVISSSNARQTLTSSTTTMIPFLVQSLEAVLLPGGISLVDWTASNIQVRNDATGNTIAGTNSHVTGTNVASFTPATVLQDGSYSMIITAVSTNGAVGAYQYQFYITTVGVTYINLSGAGENSTTYLRISVYNTANSGIVDTSNAITVPASALSVTTLATSAAPPSGYQTLGNVVKFSVGSPFALPVTFNANLCSATLRMHFTNANISTLVAAGQTTSNLQLWQYDGVTWTQITSIGAPTGAGSDYYIEATISGISSIDNAFALMYLPAAVPTPVVTHTAYRFVSTKAFNPAKETAKIYYSSTITNVETIKAYVYTTSGTLLRTMEYSKTPALFTGSDTDPYNPADTKYYMVWDGKNDSGAVVKNGLYVIKADIKKTSGSSKLSKTIAVVK